MRVAIFSHCVIDTIQTGNISNEQVGGPACYCSITAKILKFDTTLYTKFGNDFPKDVLISKNIDFENSLRSIWAKNPLDSDSLMPKTGTTES